MKKARSARGFSQSKVAGRCGMSRAYVSKVERGESSMTTMGIHALAHALNVPPAWLFEPSGEVPGAKHPWRV